MSSPATPGHDLAATLAECRLWRGVSPVGLERLAGRARAVQAHRGAELAQAGAIADELGVLLRGKARVIHRDTEGRVYTYERLEVPDVIGAAPALSGGRHPATVEAVTPVAVAWLDRDTVFELLEDEPAVARHVVSELADRLVHFTEFVQSLTLDVPSRLAQYLFRRALATGTLSPAGLAVELDISRADLASVLGTVPETLSRAFATLRDEDLVDVHDRQVIIRDVGALVWRGAGAEGDPGD